MKSLMMKIRSLKDLISLIPSSEEDPAASLKTRLMAIRTAEIPRRREARHVSSTSMNSVLTLLSVLPKARSTASSAVTKRSTDAYRSLTDVLRTIPCLSVLRVSVRQP